MNKDKEWIPYTGPDQYTYSFETEDHGAAEAFDPEPWAALLETQCPGWPALAATMRSCHTQWPTDQGRYFLADPSEEATHEPTLAIVWLTCPQRGDVSVSVLPDGRISSVEVWNEALKAMSAHYAPSLPERPEPLSVVHRTPEA